MPKQIEPQSPIQIEKGIPIPPKRNGSNHKYPWAQMAIGDSFFVPIKGSLLGTQRNLLTCASRLRPKRFQTSAVDGGVRVWRIE